MWSGGGSCENGAAGGLLKRRAETPTQHFSSTKHSRGSGRGQRVGYLESPPKVSLQVLLTGTVPTRHAGRPVSLLLNAWREAALGKCMADCDDGEGRQACLQKIRDIEETGPCAWSRIESQAKRKQRPKLPKLRILLACLAGIKQRPKATAQRTSRRARWPRPTPPSALGTVAVRGRGRRRTARDAAAATGRPPRQAARDGPPAAAATRAAARPADGRPRPWRGGPSSCSRCPPSSS